MIRKALPFSLVLTSLLLSSCALGGTKSPPDAAQSPASTPQDTVKQEQLIKQLAEPTPRPEPPFRAVLEAKAAKTSAKVGDRVAVTISVSGIQQPITTLSGTFVASPGLRIVSIVPHKSSFPLEFKKSVSDDGRSASLAVSNGEGVSGRADAAVITVEAVSEGVGTLIVEPNDTSLLLKNNTDVTPASDSLPTVSITVTK